MGWICENPQVARSNDPKRKYLPLCFPHGGQRTWGGRGGGWQPSCDKVKGLCGRGEVMVGAVGRRWQIPKQTTASLWISHVDSSDGIFHPAVGPSRGDAEVYQTPSHPRRPRGETSIISHPPPKKKTHAKLTKKSFTCRLARVTLDIRGGGGLGGCMKSPRRCEGLGCLWKVDGFRMSFATDAPPRGVTAQGCGNNSGGGVPLGVLQLQVNGNTWRAAAEGPQERGPDDSTHTRST